ncbi:ABC transporter permease subunit [Nitratireductor indicus]|uniref:ABC transporter permease subunit n=1 Tax=Nitratireductor indicus TaxID=721133 RepID=UPI0028756D9E|nr:ABC transporter permease subunit [Nitratireductor indicus]MDS1137694.1 ABC transporter permease subunit [Nitratireductor indicus]
MTAASLSASPRNLRLRANALWLAAPAIAFLIVFFLIPVGRLLFLSIQGDTGNLTAEHYSRLLHTEVYWRILIITFRIAGLTAFFSLLLGYPLAYWLSQLRENRRNQMLLLVLVPFWTSYLVKAFAWMLLLGNQGVLNRLLGGAGIIDGPLPLMYNEFGVIVGMVHAMMPLAVLTMMPVMSGIDTRLSQAAGTLGANGAHRFWMVYFPLSIPGMAAGGLLTFITSLGFFIVPAFLGGRQQTMLAQLIIIQVQELVNWAFAGVLATMLLVSALIACWIYNHLFGLASLSAGNSTTDKTSSAWTRRFGFALLEKLAWATSAVTNRFAGKSRGRLLPAYVALIVFFLVVPTLMVIPIAFTSSDFLEFPPPGYSTRWFSLYFNSPIWISATVRSFGVAFATAIAATVIGGFAALAIARSRSRFGGVVFAFMLAPMIVPRIVIAVGLFYLFAQMGLVATNLGLVIGHTVLSIPFTFVAIAAVLKGYDWRLDQAAASLGAGRFQVLRLITVPLIRGGVISAFLFAFVTSFDELTIAIFVSGGLKSTLPKQMWDDMILQLNPTLAAVSVVVLVIVTAILLVADRLRR